MASKQLLHSPDTVWEKNSSRSLPWTLLPTTFPNLSDSGRLTCVQHSSTTLPVGSGVAAGSTSLNRSRGYPSSFSTSGKGVTDEEWVLLLDCISFSTSALERQPFLNNGQRDTNARVCAPSVHANRVSSRSPATVQTIYESILHERSMPRNHIKFL